MYSEREEKQCSRGFHNPELLRGARVERYGIGTRTSD